MDVANTAVLGRGRLSRSEWNAKGTSEVSSRCGVVAKQSTVWLVDCHDFMWWAVFFR